MKSKKTIYQFTYVLLLLLAIIIIFFWYTEKNNTRIEERNKSYVQIRRARKPYRSMTSWTMR